MKWPLYFATQQDVDSSRRDDLDFLLQLLLGSEVVAVSARLLPAVGGPGVEPGVAHAADHLVAVVLLGKNPQRWLDDSSTQSQHQVKGGLLLDVVVRQSSR